MRREGRTEIAIVGAGPVALFAVFQLGLFGFKCHVFDAMERAGGQCVALYADKPIFDIPAFPRIMGEELIERLREQIAPYEPIFNFGHVVQGMSMPGNAVTLSTDKGCFDADAVVIASGLGAFSGEGQILRPDPLSRCELARNGNAIAVDPETFRTSQPGIYAIGDACHYPGKLKLILSGFHEAALMTQALRQELLR